MLCIGEALLWFLTYIFFLNWILICCNIQLISKVYVVCILWAFDNQIEGRSSFFFFPFVCVCTIMPTDTHKFVDWQSAICSLEDVHTIKPGKVSSHHADVYKIYWLFSIMTCRNIWFVALRAYFIHSPGACILRFLLNLSLSIDY